MEKKHKRKKSSGKEGTTDLLNDFVISNENTREIVQHEDHALKAAAQFFKEEILPYFKIEGKVVGMAPTESIYLELKKFFQDINFVMDDGTWKHFEFQSKDGGVDDLKRFRAYESVAGYLYNVEITTYVFYSGDIKNPVTELTEGINTYRVIPLVMQKYDAMNYIQKIREKVDRGVKLSKADFIPLTLCPLMGGEMSQKERIRQVFDITRKAECTEKNVIQMIESVIYTMADKFLNKEEMKEIMEEISMTTLGQMLVDKGFNDGFIHGIKSSIEVCKYVNLTKEKVLDILSDKFSLSKEKVEEYINLYW